MWQLFFACLLLKEPLQSDSSNNKDPGDPGDPEFFLRLTRTYLCTGDSYWWKKIPDPKLRVPMQFAVLTMCTPDIDQQGAVKELDKNARAAMDIISKEKRNTINECLWSSIKEWIVIPFFAH